VPGCQILRGQEKKRELVLVFGRTGVGKTLWTRLYARQKKRVYIYDPMDEYAEPDDAAYESDPRYVERLAAAAASELRTTLIIEEAGSVFRKGVATLPKVFQDLVFRGRHYAHSAVFVGQRPTSVPIDVRSQANRVVSFALHEGDDLDYLSDIYGRITAKKIALLPPLTCFDCLWGDTTTYSISSLVSQLREV